MKYDTKQNEYYQLPLSKEQLHAYDNSAEVLHAKRFRSSRDNIYFDSKYTNLFTR